VGDSYASEGGPSRHRGYSDPKWAKARNGSFDEPTAYPQGIKPKSLMLLPERFAIGMIDQGWTLRNKIIWYKRNGMPSPFVIASATNGNMCSSLLNQKNITLI